MLCKCHPSVNEIKNIHVFSRTSYRACYQDKFEYTFYGVAASVVGVSGSERVVTISFLLRGCGREDCSVLPALQTTNCTCVGVYGIIGCDLGSAGLWYQVLQEPVFINQVIKKIVYWYRSFKTTSLIRIRNYFILK